MGYYYNFHQKYLELRTSLLCNTRFCRLCLVGIPLKNVTYQYQGSCSLQNLSASPHFTILPPTPLFCFINQSPTIPVKTEKQLIFIPSEVYGMIINEVNIITLRSHGMPPHSLVYYPSKFKLHLLMRPIFFSWHGETLIIRN